ncbi:MAG: type IX secretion system sortase PorU [Bacteroidota bacterium]
MIRHWAIFGLFILISSSLFSQSDAIQRKVEWEEPRNFQAYKQNKLMSSGRYLFFKGAHYPDQKTVLPFFSELFSLQNGAEVEVTLEDLKFTPLNHSDVLTNEAKKYIEQEIRVSSDVYFSGRQPKLSVKFVPVRKNPNSGRFEKLEEFTIRYNTKTSKSHKAQSDKAIPEESVLGSGKWMKIRVKESGIYKLTYSQLEKMGFENLSNINIYGNSEGVLPINNKNFEDKDIEKNAIQYKLGDDNEFNKGDYILFYAKSPHQWSYDEKTDFFYRENHPYTDHNYFFITDSKGAPKIINKQTQPPGNADQVITDFVDFTHHEKNEKNLLTSGRLWVGERFDMQNQKSFSFDFPNMTASSTVKFRTEFIGRSPLVSNLLISNKDQLIEKKEISPVSFNFTGDYAKKVTVLDSFQSNNTPIDLTLEYNKSSSSSMGWLDYITVNAQRELKMEGKQMHFRIPKNENPEQVEVQLEGAENVQAVWEVTDPNNVKKIEYSLSNKNVIKFNAVKDTIWREFIAITEDGAYSPKEIGPVENQNLHGLTNADMVIVTKDKYLNHSREIAELHEKHDNMKIHVVTDRQIYNEFSSGCPDPSAIRNFVRMMYERSTENDSLQYLLLFGDGTYDNRECHTNDNLITYQSKVSLNYSNSFVSDDFFGLLDQQDNTDGRLDGLIDIGVGRIPVGDAQEAENAVRKIRYYMEFLDKGFWTNKLCFVADDEDNNLHMRDADKLTRFVDDNYPSFDISKIYLDNYPQETSSTGESYPEVNREIREKINNGLLLFNYTGHGGEHQLANEKIFTEEDINALVNFPKMPVFMTATCEFTRWDAANYTSAGEKVFLNSQGGAIALFSTTRLVYASLNYNLNKAFYDFVFEKNENGRPHKLGDIVRYTKNNAGEEDNKRNFSLIGDPALTLPLGEKKLITDSLLTNNSPGDTLQSLDKVSIKGHVENYSGTTEDNYSGKAFIRVKGKEQKITTKANDGGSPFQYKHHKSTLFKGAVTVKNGYFESNFVVPRDMISEYGTGKANYLASNDAVAQGADTSFTVGGTSDNVMDDEQGPEIDLYMNDKDFVSGGITNENPVLYAKLNDKSGINISGSGLGHDLTAIIDGDVSNKIILNDYYQAEEDSYKEGKVEYQLSSLEKGSHTLKLEAWDVNNNLSTSSIEFRVAGSDDLKLDHVLNYPNPFTESTQFYFEHNRPNEQLDILIQIFTVTGKLVKSIHEKVTPQGFRVGPIPWDGYDDFGDNIGKGVYIYRLKVRSEDGETAEKTEKLVILK